MHIRNAIIDSVSLSTSDHGLLTMWLRLDYGGSGQGFGGFSLYLPKSFGNHKMMGPAGHFIFRCMEVAGVTDFKNLNGRCIRVKSDAEGIGGKIVAIGHIINDDWFNPAEDFKNI